MMSQPFWVVMGNRVRGPDGPRNVGDLRTSVKISSLQVLQYNAQGAIVKDRDDYIDALDSCGVVLPTAEHTDNES